ncbi:MAG TPA: hypothetical protein H9815_04605 [Candidatus Ruania gallistercoris]|uniref:Uncharacterized protein n=1 Tax=Candidatus Ruania gallistercoris TaxID=2838746 RepID=A0A9D2ED89_9MICO|nr:hypothetical protein [Candidatus Ruania gallistercoris]
MGRNFSSGLLAGVVAATIWMAVSLWQGMATETVGMWALVLLVGTTILSTVVAGVVSRSTGRSPAPQRS